MKAKLIKRAALAVAILAGGGVAYGDTESALQVVYCKVTIITNAGNEIVSVTLPPTEGYYDNNGNPLTYWNVGNVPAGGVADSWHGEGGPGRFTAKNAGNVGAYFYVATGRDYHRFSSPNQSSSDFQPDHDIFYNILNAHQYLYLASISPSELRKWTRTGNQDNIYAYHLAFSTEIMDRVPTWHSLDHRFVPNRWSTEEVDYPGAATTEVAGYMGYVDAGDYLTFDLKFWAPSEIRGYNYGPYVPSGINAFTFCVEASSFPLWDHGRGIE